MALPRTSTLIFFIFFCVCVSQDIGDPIKISENSIQTNESMNEANKLILGIYKK